MAPPHRSLTVNRATSPNFVATHGESGFLAHADTLELDVDRDGRLHRRQFADAMENLHQRFDRLDGNGDGFIDVREAAVIRRWMDRRRP